MLQNFQITFADTVNTLDQAADAVDFQNGVPLICVYVNTKNKQALKQYVSDRRIEDHCLFIDTTNIIKFVSAIFFTRRIIQLIRKGSLVAIAAQTCSIWMLALHKVPYVIWLEEGCGSIQRDRHALNSFKQVL